MVDSCSTASIWIKRRRRRCRTYIVHTTFTSWSKYRHSSKKASTCEVNWCKQRRRWNEKKWKRSNDTVHFRFVFCFTFRVYILCAFVSFENVSMAFLLCSRFFILLLKLCSSSVGFNATIKTARVVWARSPSSVWLCVSLKYFNAFIYNARTMDTLQIFCLTR